MFREVHRPVPVLAWLRTMAGCNVTGVIRSLDVQTPQADKAVQISIQRCGDNEGAPRWAAGTWR